MNKTARLDQILLRLGYCSQDQITRALQRQSAHGGRLGGNLLALGAITEAQLLAALSEQFRIPTLIPEERNLRPDLIRRMPQDVLAHGLALPLSWNPERRELTIATANPTDAATMRRVKEAFGAASIRVALAPDRLLRTLGGKAAPPSTGGETRRIVLPELFAHESVQGGEDVRSAEIEGPVKAHVLMVTAAVSRKNVLPSVFQREGYQLTVASEPGETAEALRSRDISKVLLSEEMVESFASWVRSGRVPQPAAEIVVFPSVSGALLENPLPYDATSHSLRSAVQALADSRCSELGASPPYGLISSEVEALAERQGLRRVARDGLQLTLHLLLPGNGPATTPGDGANEPFTSFASSLELATRLHFPWKLDTVLVTCHALHTGRVDLRTAAALEDEYLLAGQILSIVWYRHNHLDLGPGGPEERMLALRTGLRAQGGRLATQQLIEGYIRLIAERGGVREELGDRQVLLVGGERIVRALSPALARVGREALATADLADAQALVERLPPAAIVIDHAEFSEQVDRFTRVTKLGIPSLLFVVTDSTEPALVLNLLDVGVDDVFAPPHDLDLVAARINRAIRSRSRDRGSARRPTGQFSATFGVFSFVDLIQMLGHGLKTVRIDVTRGNGDSAVLLMQKGELIHASLGELHGEEVIFRLLGWEDDAEFTVCEESRFPTRTIHAATQSVLLEGLRRLDEATRPANTRP